MNEYDWFSTIGIIIKFYMIIKSFQQNSDDNDRFIIIIIHFQWFLIIIDE